MVATQAMLLVMFQGAAVLFIALGIPLLIARLRMNASTDYLPPGMLRDAAAWRSINVATGRDLIAIGATLALLALILWLANATPVVFGVTCAGWLLLGATGIIFHALFLLTQQGLSPRR